MSSGCGRIQRAESSLAASVLVLGRAASMALTGSRTPSSGSSMVFIPNWQDKNREGRLKDDSIYDHGKV